AIPGRQATPVQLTAARRVLGYQPATPAEPGRLSLVSLLAPGRAAPTSVLLYADGLDYLKIGEDPAWAGPQPFGPVTLNAERVSVRGGRRPLYDPPHDRADRTRGHS